VATSAEAEVEKMRRVPGIVFVDGPCGRVARVAGTGLEVFEIIKHYRAFGNDWERLRLRFDWLSDEQFRAAVTYAERYGAEIDALLAEEERLTPEYVRSKYPFTAPRHA